MAAYICTNCGYEGKPVKSPDDHESGWVMGFLNRLFFLLTLLPIKFDFLVRMAKRQKAKTCPNCGLPYMVKLSSDAGWMAKRKLEIKAGAVVIGEEKKAEAFGRDFPVAEQKPAETPKREKPVDPEQW
jgi:hypothetical protein